MAKRAAWVALIPLLLATAVMLGPCTSAALAASTSQMVSVALKWPAEPAGLPRSNIALSYEVTNGALCAVDVVERVTLPDGLRWITPSGRLNLAPGASRIRVHSVAIAAYAPAGTYPVVYELLDAENGATIAKESVNLEVQAAPDLSVLATQAPKYVVAGENYVLRFIVTNTGNAAANVELEATQQEGFTATYSRQLRLAAGASQEVEVVVKGNTAIRAEMTHRLTLRAVTVGAKAEATAAVAVIPVVAGEAYHLLPVQAQAKVAVDGAGHLDASVSLSGKGYLDEEARYAVEFRLNNESSNYLKYRSSALDLVVGQTSPGVSALTGALPSSGMGLGVGYTALQDEWLTIRGNFAADRAGRVASAEARVDFAPGWRMTLEAAAGSKAGESAVAAALRADMQAAGAGMGRYRLSLTYGQEGFFGRYANGLLLEASAELPRLGPVTAGAAYIGKLGHGDGAEWASQYGAYVNIFYMKGGSASLWYRTPAIGSAAGGEGSITARITQKLGPAVLNARYDMELGKPERDALRLSLEYSPMWRQRYEAYYAGTGVRSDDAAYTLGVKASFWLNPQAWALLDISRTLGTATPSTNVQGSLRYDLAKSLTLTAAAKATKADVGTWTAEVSASLTATHRFSVAVSELKSVGRLTGRVFDACSADKRPLAGIAVRVGSAAAITGADGVFQFNGLVPGVYYVQVDIANISEGCIPAVAMPSAVTVAAGETTRLDIPITRKASLSGRVVRYEVISPLAIAAASGGPGTNGNGNGLSEAGGLAGVIVAATLGDETRYAVTDANGRFSFTELRPGAWEVKVIASGRWPQGFNLDPIVTTATLDAGGKAEVLIKALPVAKPLHIIEGGRIASI